jgi:retron-type reverse transcriptase
MQTGKVMPHGPTLKAKRLTGPQWFVDSDITGDFKNIDHDMLRELLKKRLEDTQFFDLIRDMLTAGSVEDWQFHKTYCGTPQGGSVSPMLANISLHALDACMEQKTQACDQGKARHQTTEWLNTTCYVWDDRKRRDARKGDPNPAARTKQERYEQKIRELSAKQKRLPASDPLDLHDSRLCSVRYAADSLIGVIGNTQEAETRFKDSKTWLSGISRSAKLL